MNVSMIHNWGLILLSIWLIVTGILNALSIGNQVIRVILGIIAVIAGILILLGK